MNAASWEKCADPRLMLQHLEGKASERKLRLFAVAVCRTLWPWLTEPCSRDAVMAAEALAEGELGASGLGTARKAIRAGVRDWHRAEVFNAALGGAGSESEAEAEATRWAASWDAARETLRWEAHGAALCASNAVSVARCFPADQKRGIGTRAEWARQADVLRCICGNPYRPVVVPPECRTPTVIALALAAYENRQLPSGELERDRLLVLSDALEEAGATEDVLGPLRAPGPRYRGFFVLDAVLGKS